MRRRSRPSHAAPARPPQAGGAGIEAGVDRLFARWQTPDSPGCSVGVSRGGATVLERGYGQASLELGVPITPQSVFHVASVTKQFTAMSILLLARDGRLSIDDDVRRHLPEWAGPPGVTIRHLLTHTGGLRDVFLLIELAAPETGRPVQDQLVGLLARQRGLSDEPGRRYVYNNGGYVLLAEIVKRVSGQSLRAFADDRIFRPLGMRQSHLHDDVAEVVAKLATGYTRGADGALRVARQTGGLVGNGGLFTTVGDLLRWERNFAEPRVGDASIIASMETPPALPGGERPSTVSACSWSAMAAGAPSGTAAAIKVSARTWCVTRTTISPSRSCATSTRSTPSSSPTASRTSISAPSPGRRTRLPASPRRRRCHRRISPPTRACIAIPTDEALLRIFLRDGTLRGSPGAGADGGWPIVPLGGNRFRIPTTTITLEFAGGASGARTLRIVGERPTPAVLERVASYTPSAAELAGLAGDYRSDELSTTYALRVRTAR